MIEVIGNYLVYCNTVYNTRDGNFTKCNCVITDGVNVVTDYCGDVRTAYNHIDGKQYRVIGLRSLNRYEYKGWNIKDDTIDLSANRTIIINNRKFLFLTFTNAILEVSNDGSRQLVNLSQNSTKYIVDIILYQGVVCYVTEGSNMNGFKHIYDIDTNREVSNESKGIIPEIYIIDRTTGIISKYVLELLIKININDVAIKDALHIMIRRHLMAVRLQRHMKDKLMLNPKYKRAREYLTRYMEQQLE